MIALVAHPQTHTEAGLRRCPVAMQGFYTTGRQCPNQITRGDTMCTHHRKMADRITPPVRRRPR